MAESTGGLFRSFVRDLRWQVPLAVGPMIALWALDVAGMRDLGFVNAVLLGLGFVFVLGPLAWLRWQHLGRHDKPFWIFLGLAFLWMFVALGIVGGVLAIVGVD